MTSTSRGQAEGLRLVLYSVLPPALGLLMEWAKRHEHRVLLLITTPGPAARRSTSYRDIVAMAPPGQEILITTRMKRTVPIIAELAPDLIVSASFPYRIPPEVTAIPRIGAVNLHPSPLPAFRGPNPLRQFYEDAPELGATLHRTEEGFDTGVIYSRQARPMPEDMSMESLVPLWFDAMSAALEEGTRRAILGEPGIPQDERLASYGGPFSEDERALDWSLPARALQRRVTALGFMGGEAARAVIDGKSTTVQRVTPLRGVPSPGAPGQVLARAAGTVVLCCGDGVIQVTTLDTDESVDGPVD